LEHATIILSIVAAMAYVLGTLSLSSFAAQFDVAPSDLGLEFRDQVVVFVITAALLIGLLVTVFGSVSLLQRWEPPKTARAQRGLRALLTFVVYAGLGALAAVIADYLNFNFISVLIAAYLVLGIAYATTDRVRTHERPLWALASLLGVVLVAVLIWTTVQSSRSWGSELRQWPSDCAEAEKTVRCDRPPLGPPGLAVVFQPTFGIVNTAAGKACALRVSEHLFVGVETAALVEPTLFVAEECTPVDRPLS
jgi:vacuolar-type H+-ATPase subunit I/STV1